MGSRGVGWGSQTVAVGGAVALLVALAGDAPSVTARETPAIGEAERVVSEVRGIFGAITRELVVQDEVYSQEVIETGTEAATRIVFVDGTELSMGPMSRVTLDRYVYDPASGTGELVVNFISGIFEFASGLIPATGYDLRTPFANLAIRGTTIQLRVGLEGLEATPRAGSITVFDAQTTLDLDDPESCVIWRIDGSADIVSLPECQQLLEQAFAMLALLEEPGAGPPAPIQETGDGLSPQ